MWKVTTDIIFKSGASTQFYNTWDNLEDAEEDKQQTKDFLNGDKYLSDRKYLCPKENYGLVRENVDFYLVVIEEVAKQKHAPTYEYKEK